jgi:hypothetical protein
MPEEKVLTGVEPGSVAGSQEAVDYEKLLFGDEPEDAGVEEEEVAAPDEPKEEEPGIDVEKDPHTAEAFAKRLAQKEASLKDELRKSLSEEIRAELTRELEATKTTQAQQQQGAPAYRGLSDEEVEKLADDLEASPKMVRAFLEQQMRLNQTEEMLRQNTQRDQNRVDYNDGVQFAQGARAQNPALPEWNDAELHKVRMEHYRNHGITLPWKQAYQILVAQSVVSGDLTRQAQQDVITQIKERDKTTVGLKSPAPQKLDIWDLPQEEWEKIKAEGARGKYSKT